MRQGKPTEKMDDRPVLLPRLRPVYQAWQLLGAARPMINVGFGAVPGPLPFTEIDAYARRFGPQDDDDFEEFLLLLRKADQTYLGLEAEQQKAKSEKDKKARPPKGRSRGARR